MTTLLPISCADFTIRRCMRLLLALPVCIVLASCDSASSSANNKNTQGAPINSTASAASSNDDAVLTKNDAEELVESNVNSEAQSLMATASLTESTARSPMISTANNDSMLQATLMGDYGGVVPCSSCLSTNVTLNLFADGSVLKTSVFNQSETPQPPMVESGVYRQDSDVITIVYQTKNIETYQIQDNHLIMMNEYKNPDEDYALSRQ